MNARLNSALILLDRALEEIETGFVACNRCGDQEDTKNLDFVDDLKTVKSELLELVKQEQEKPSKIEEAKKVHSVVMQITMALNGIGEATSESVEKFKSFSLIEILEANKAMVGYREEQQDGRGHKVYVTTTEQSLAETYIRVHNQEFLAADEFQEICAAMDDYNEDTVNGHCVLIDSVGYYTLGELSSSGEDINKTIKVFDTPRSLYGHVLSLVKEKDDEE